MYLILQSLLTEVCIKNNIFAIFDIYF